MKQTLHMRTSDTTGAIQLFTNALLFLLSPPVSGIGVWKVSRGGIRPCDKGAIIWVSTDITGIMGASADR